MASNYKVKKMKVETNALQDKKENPAAKDGKLEVKIGILEENLKSEKKRIDDMKKEIECPVCLEVPRKGPIFSCPNGHLVCQKCKRESCPTCREVMGDNKSLVAVKLIERILHDCKFVECEEEFPLNEIDEHEKICKHRDVTCPHSQCVLKVPLSKLLAYLESNHFCRTPKVAVDGLVANLSVATLARVQANFQAPPGLTLTFCYGGHSFALTVRMSGNYWHFVIVMFESPEVCAEFKLEMEVQETIKSPADTPLGVKALCHPCSIDQTGAEMEGSGLIVHRKLVEEMSIKEGRIKFNISTSKA